MNKKWGLLVVTFFILTTVSAQTLFTYGSYSSDAKDFLRAFNKNNTVTAATRARVMRNYLDLYIASRLKIQEAYNRHYDTIPQIKNDIEQLRAQIIENYLNDPATIERLTKEAFKRSQKDIHVAHIFISFKDNQGVIDSAQAEKKINEVYEKLKKGADFFSLAQQYSADPTVKTNKGDIGYITVFTLPYEFENIVYNTPAGKFSSPFRSKIGFHIFKNLGERKAVGRIKIAQILLAFPPNTDDASKKKTALLADSLYKQLVKGDDISKLAAQFSNDYISAASGGLVPEFGVGQYDADFEKVAFSLTKDGQISRPVLSSHGYHIIKRIGAIAVVTDPNNKANMDELKARVNTSDRVQFAKNIMIESALKKISIKRYPYSEKDLMIFSDSLLERKHINAPITITRTTPLFSIGDQMFTVNDYINYALVWRFKSDGSGVKPQQQLMGEFTRHVAEEYYRSHLEDFNSDFRYQMNEFRDGNLFFEIMQREVWGKAQNDSSALETYYQKNKNRYNWKQSADAVIFFCADEGSAKKLFGEISKNPSGWKTASDAMSEKVVTDSARYEFEQIPNGGKIILKPGVLTSPLKNNADGTFSFAYVLKTYPANMPRNYNEAKGLVVSDYQNELEKKWVEELKVKYPVKINEKVLEQIAK